MRFRPVLRGFWEHDPGLSVLLVALVLLAFVLPPVMESGHEQLPLADLLLTLLLVAGLGTLRVRTGVRVLLMAAAVVAVAIRLWPTTSTAAGALATLVSLVLMAAVVLVQTFRDGPVNIHRVQGAVAAYLLLGLAWAAAYALVAQVAPGAFATARAETSQSRTFIYFSFVTLTTVGYGDVTPVHHAARSLALLEALVGQLYPAILLARIVTLHTQRRDDG
jgi:hypothetical protein